MIKQKNYMPEKYLIGHQAIDTQHEVLFVFYNELLHSLNNPETGYNLADIFMGLNEYVATHFRYEEEAMVTAHYDDDIAHCEEHRQLTNDVGQLQGRFRSAKNQDEEKTVAYDVARFLADWLEHHIAEVDRKLVQFLNNQSALS